MTILSMRHLHLFALSLLVAGCQLVKPKEEEATIYRDKYQTLCACCGGWRIRVGSATYRAFDLPKAYSTEDSIQVYIRYKDDSSTCGKVMSDLIVLTSIRAR